MKPLGSGHDRVVTVSRAVSSTVEAALTRAFLLGSSAKLCFAESELLRRLRRLDRVRALLLGRLSGEVTKDEHRVLVATARLCRSAEHYLATLVHIKRSEGHEAWSQLIDAQEMLTAAVRGFVPAEFIPATKVYWRTLGRVEDLCFPVPRYVSMSVEAGKRTCSICGQSPLECVHEPGEYYEGKQCHFSAEDLEFRNLSFVAQPRNKRAVWVQITKDATVRDLYRGTLRPAAPEQEEPKALVKTVITTASLSTDPPDWEPLLRDRR